jgi:hypothetical protein
MSELIYCANGCTRNHEGTRIPVTTQPPSLLCVRCEDNLRAWLKEIPERYALLPTFIDHGTTPKDPDHVVTRQTEAPAPMRLEIVDLLDTRRGRKWSGIAPALDRRGTLGTLHAHAQRIRDEKALASQPHPTVTTETQLIQRWLLWLTEQDWVTEPYRELRMLHRQLGDAIGEHRPRPVGTCVVDYGEGECGGPLLPSRLGGVHCPRCDATWDIDELRRLGLILTQEPA